MSDRNFPFDDHAKKSSVYFYKRNNLFFSPNVESEWLLFMKFKENTFSLLLLRASQKSSRSTFINETL